MADFLIEFLRATSSDALTKSLKQTLHNLETCHYQALYDLDLVQILLGRKSDSSTDDIVPEDFNSWNDYIFRRLGLLLRERGDGQKSLEQDTPAYRQLLFTVVAIVSLYAFCQSNITGPPLPIDSARLLLASDTTLEQSKVSAVRKDLIGSLSVDGDAAHKLIPNVELFCLADTILTCPPIVKNIPAARWAKVRVDFLHQRLLSDPSATLQASLYDGLAALESSISQLTPGVISRDARANFLLERAAVHTHYGFDKKAKQDLDSAARLRQFGFALTGVLGKRTKFQEKETSQLVVLALSAANDRAQESNGMPDEGTHKRDKSLENNNGAAGVHDHSQPVALDLNDDTLLESISFTKKAALPEVKDAESLPERLASLDPTDQPRLEPLDSVILLSFTSSITNTSPADGLTREETLPYATRVIEGGSSNWQVYTQALLVRSRIESYKSRTTERGLLQLQALVDQVIAETSPQRPSSDSSAANTFLPKANPSESAPAPERLRYLFALSSPTRWELEAELAARWVSLGGLRSALDIYERLHMWAEAALCWAATDREDRARRILREQLFLPSSSSSTTTSPPDPSAESYSGPPREPPPSDAPRLLCILGDLDSDPAHYERAWAVSNGRYARAQRSLGRHHLRQGAHAAAAQAYSKSLRVSALDGGAWFALGCALLELAEFGRAVEAFARCVQLDDADAEAWSNLAAALLKSDAGGKGGAEEGGQVVDDGEPAGAEGSKDGDDEGVAEEVAADPQERHRARRTYDALNAFRRAAQLKHDSPRIWENVLAVSLMTRPPSLADLVAAQSRLIDLRGAAAGESCVDAPALGVLVAHLEAEAGAAGGDGAWGDEAPRGLARTALALFDKVRPLITTSAPLWRLVARLAALRGDPGGALAAREKAWRCVVGGAGAGGGAGEGTAGWDGGGGTEAQWDSVVAETEALAGGYREFGGRDRAGGLGAGEPVARDWRFKARSAVRGVMGRGRENWEGTEGWERLAGVLEGLKGS